MKPRLLNRPTLQVKPSLEINPYQRTCLRCWAINDRHAQSCFMCNGDKLRWTRKKEHPPSRVFIALGPEPSFGRGVSPESALQSLWERWPRGTASKANGWTIKLWDAPLSSTVSGKGGIVCQPHDKPAKLVREYKLWSNLFVPCDFLTAHPHALTKPSDVVLLFLKSPRALDKLVRTNFDDLRL